MEITKNLVGIVAIICLTALQITAFILGIDGQVLSFTSAAITAILGYLLGIKMSKTPSDVETTADQT